MAIAHRPDTGYLGRESRKEYLSQVDDTHTHKVVVHRFKVGDVDDPDVFAGEHLWKWQNSEAGVWIMKQSLATPEWHRHMDFSSYCYEYAITAILTDRDYTYYLLKWS